MNNSVNSANRLQHLDFYKGICILFIIITHYNWTDQQRLAYGFPFWIDMAVPIFMVITGYVSALSKKRNLQVYFSHILQKQFLQNG